MAAETGRETRRQEVTQAGAGSDGGITKREVTSEKQELLRGPIGSDVRARGCSQREVTRCPQEAAVKANLGEVVDRLLEGTHDDFIQEGHGLVT